MPSKTTTPLRQKAEAVAAVKTKAGADAQGKQVKKPTAKKPATTKGKPVARLTSVWPDAKGKDVPMKATVRFEEKQWTVKSRFTSRSKDGVLTPCLALAPKGRTGKGKHTPAKTVTLA
jgi:hypothetical protein